jgi:hypothetical protein
VTTESQRKKPAKTNLWKERKEGETATRRNIDKSECWGKRALGGKSAVWVAIFGGSENNQTPQTTSLQAITDKLPHCNLTRFWVLGSFFLALCFFAWFSILAVFGFFS